LTATGGGDAGGGTEASSPDSEHATRNAAAIAATAGFSDRASVWALAKFARRVESTKPTTIQQFKVAGIDINADRRKTIRSRSEIFLRRTHARIFFLKLNES
jgi:hypothetical protein